MNKPAAVTTGVDVPLPYRITARGLEAMMKDRPIQLRLTAKGRAAVVAKKDKQAK